MDGDDKFWLSLGGMVMLMIILIVAIVSFSGKAKNDQIVEMVKHGANPIQARCSIINDELIQNEMILCSDAHRVTVIQQPPTVIQTPQ